MRPTRQHVALAAFAAGALGLLAIVWVVVMPQLRPDPGPTPVSTVGGPFELTTQNGEKLSSADLAGKPFAVFFGFTHCPDVCPTTLWDISQALEDLGSDADDLKVLFVSLDPERDTPELLKSYLQSFDPRIVGLTGDRPSVEAMARAYRVYWKKVPLEGDDYTLDHTAGIYLMDGQGRFVEMISYQASEKDRVEKLRRLVERS